MLALVVSIGSFINSYRATNISNMVAQSNREPKISLTNVQLNEGEPGVVTYDVKNFGQAKANALGIVPVTITPRMHMADQRSAIAEIVLDSQEQISRTYDLDPSAFVGYNYSADNIRNGFIPFKLDFDVAYRDSDDRVTHKCVPLKYVAPTHKFDRDSDCPQMYSSKENPF